MPLSLKTKAFIHDDMAKHWPKIPYDWGELADWFMHRGGEAVAMLNDHGNAVPTPEQVLEVMNGKEHL